MAQSHITYLGDGTNRLFSIPFPFLKRDYVQVFVDSVPATFTFLSDTQIQTSAAPPDGSEVTIRRKTNTAAPLVTFTPSTLKDADLNAATRQSLHALQEFTEQNLGEAIGDAELAAQQALSYKVDAAESADEASTARTEAVEARDESVTAEAKAAEWAEKPEDVPVAPGAYSAKHHARKAELHEIGAELHKIAAVDAAGAVTAFAGFKDSEAAGLAATTNGQYFSIPGGAGSATFVGLYRNTSGVAELKGTYYSKTYFDNFIASTPLDPEVRVVFTDSSDNILLEFTSESITHPQIATMVAAIQAAAPAASAVANALGGAEVAVTDSLGYLLALISRDSIEHPAIQSLEESTRTNKVAGKHSRRVDAATLSRIHAIRTAIVHWLWYGQSLSAGAGSGHVALTMLGVFARMFNGGFFSREGFASTDTATLTGSRRTSLTAVEETVREVGARAALLMFEQLLREEDGIDISASGQEILVSAAGVGGVNIQSLASTYFFRVNEDFEAAAALAASASKSYSVGMVAYFGNENNQSTATVASFRDALRSMRAQIEAAATAKVGIAQLVPMLTYQTNTHLSTASANFYNVEAQVAQGQLAAALNADNVDANIAMATPTYFLKFPDGVHPDAMGYLWMCAYFGLAAKRWFVDGIKPRPLAPLSAKLYGNFIRLEFDPPPGCQLAWDTTTVPVQPNYGFRVRDSLGNSKTISSVRLAGPRHVEIALTGSTPVIGDRVDYAFTTNVPSGTVGLGNLRDTQGDFIVARFGIDKPLHNWCPLNSIGITA